MSIVGELEQDAGATADPLTLTLPNGTTWKFESAAALAAFKKRAGLP